MVRPQKSRSYTGRHVRAVYALRTEAAAARRAAGVHGLRLVPAADDAAPTDQEPRR